MAELIACEPALFNEDEIWLVFSDGRKLLRKRSLLSQERVRPNFPMIGRSDTIDPVRGADGRMHTSLSTYRATLKPDGNPRGERFLELGNDELPPFKAPEFDRKTRREAIKAGIADVKAGRIPPVVTGDLP